MNESNRKIGDNTGALLPASEEVSHRRGRLCSIPQIAISLIFFLASLVSAADFIVLETEQGGKTEVVGGEASVAGKAVTPASTFKIVIAWAGMEEGMIDPSTRRRCSDAYIPGTPRELTLAEAMFYSSNQYFAWVAKKMGEKRLRQYAGKSGFFPKPIPDNWLDEGIATAAHGGNLTVDARQQHGFIQRVMNGRLASSPEIQKKLLECMVWPSSDPKIALYGKTGSWTGVAWFNGFGCQDGKWKAVTVLLVGKDAQREEAIRRFYDRWSLKPVDNR
jgi:beta-lactamase class D